MKLNNIAANFKDFPLVNLESYDSECLVDDMLKALFSEVVQPNSEQYFPDLIEKSRISLYAVIGSPYGGMHIVVIDEKPIAVMMKKMGSCEDSQQAYIVDVEAFASVATELSVAETKKRIASVDVASETLISELESSYIHFLGTQATMFAIVDPSEVHQYSNVLKAHRGYFVDTAGVVHELQTIGQISDEGMAAVTLVGGQNQLVDATQLMFELVPGKGNVTDALKEYTSTPHWVIEDAFRSSLTVFVTMQRPYCWGATMVALELDSEAEFDRFCAVYSVGNQVENYQQGMFSLEKLGYKGKDVMER